MYLLPENGAFLQPSARVFTFLNPKKKKKSCENHFCKALSGVGLKYFWETVSV